ncbi:MAG: hypothetical protein JWO82_3258 [Akkermansiaceae bacterium]|nr:hypothetical protein [Akkermansiaceae bacterium]
MSEVPFQKKAGVAIAVAAVVLTLFIAALQRDRLAGIRAEIEKRKQTNPGREPKTARTPHGRQAAGDDRGRPEMAGGGEESVPEVRALIARRPRPAPNGLYLPVRTMEEEDDADRLVELFARMGAATVSKVVSEFCSVESDPAFYFQLRALYSNVNPRQSLAWRLAEDPGDERNQAVRDFTQWAQSDPSAALRWYRELEARKDPIAEGRSFRAAVLGIEVGTDPVAAAGKIEDLSRDDPKFLQGWSGGVAGLMGGERETQIAFVSALNAAVDRNAGNSTLLQLRDSAVDALMFQARGELFRDAVVIADACFTSDQKKLFANRLTGYNAMNGKEWLDEVRWVSRLEGLKADQTHPLIGMASKQAQPRFRLKYGEPAWLDEVTDPNLRNLAVARYVSGVASSDPEEASRWLVKLPPGESRDWSVKTIVAAWEKRDPAAAKAFQAAQEAASEQH